MDGRAQGKVVVVTGAGQGIGASIAEGLALEGARIVAVDLNEDQAASVAQKIASLGGEATWAVADVTDPSAMDSAIAQAVEWYGKLDVMFNNAGVNSPRDFLNIDRQNWDLIMSVNAWGVVVGTQVAARQFIRQGTPGKIVNTTSIAGRQGFAAIAPYCASKAAVISLTQAAARSFASDGITVNAFAPGIVETPLWDALDRELDEIDEPDLKFEKMASGILMGRPAKPADIIPVATFLACSDSDYITGQIVPIDGGMILV